MLAPNDVYQMSGRSFCIEHLPQLSVETQSAGVSGLAMRSKTVLLVAAIVLLGILILYETTGFQLPRSSSTADAPPDPETTFMQGGSPGAPADNR